MPGIISGTSDSAAAATARRGNTASRSKRSEQPPRHLDRVVRGCVGRCEHFHDAEHEPDTDEGDEYPQESGLTQGTVFSRCVAVIARHRLRSTAEGESEGPNGGKDGGHDDAGAR